MERLISTYLQVFNIGFTAYLGGKKYNPPKAELIFSITRTFLLPLKVITRHLDYYLTKMYCHFGDMPLNIRCYVIVCQSIQTHAAQPNIVQTHRTVIEILHF